MPPVAKYAPSPMAVYLHGLAHPGESDFDPSFLSVDGGDEYLRSLAGIGGIAMGAEAAVIMVLLCILVARQGRWKTRSCARCAVGFNFPTIDADLNVNLGTYRIRSKGTRPLQFVVIVGLAGVAAMAWHANGSVAALRQDAHGLQASGEALGAAVRKMGADGSRFYGGVRGLPKEATRALCPKPPSAMSAQVAGLKAAAGSLRATLKVAAAPVAYLSAGGAGRALLERAWIAAEAVCAGLMGASLFGILGVATSKNRTVAGASVFALVVLGFGALVVSALLAASVGIADFCMAPDTHAVESLRALGMPTRASLARHFIYCDGAASNPLEQHLHGCVALARSLPPYVPPAAPRSRRLRPALTPFPPPPRTARPPARRAAPPPTCSLW